MALDELLKGLAVFNEGLDRFAQSKALNEADEMRKANVTTATTEMLQRQNMVKAGLMNEETFAEEAEQIQSNLLNLNTQTANTLRSKLSVAGANAAAIQTATGFVPSAASQFNAELQQALQENSQAFSRAENKANRISAKTIAELRIAAAKEKTKAELERERKKKLIPGVIVSDPDAIQKKEAIAARGKVALFTDLNKNVSSVIDLFERNKGGEIATKDAGILLSESQFIRTKLLKLLGLGVPTGRDLEIIDGVIPPLQGAVEKGKKFFISKRQEGQLRTLSKRIASSIVSDLMSLPGVTLDPNSSLTRQVFRAGLSGDQSNKLGIALRQMHPKKKSVLLKFLNMKATAGSQQEEDQIDEDISTNFGIDVRSR